jgi:hypothetical protein
MGHNIFKDTKTILCYELSKDWHLSENILNDSRITYKNVLICQWFIVSLPGQHFFLDCFKRIMLNLDTLINLNTNSSDYHNTVINNSGPVIFTKSVIDNMDNTISVLPSDYFCSGSWNGIVPITKNSYVKHHFTASWH